MTPRRLVSLVTAVALLASCSGGGSGSTDSADIRVAASSGLAPTDDGFAFANFGSANTQEFMDGEDLRLMFGDGACANGSATPCDPTSEAAAWAQMVNQSRQAGHCEGMVVQAINRYTTAATPKTSELSNEDDTTHGIIRAFATQFFPAVKKDADSWARKSLSDIVSALNESFSSKKLTYTMGLYSDAGGHAVLPISVEYPTETIAKVHIYDSNWPGQDRYVLFDLDADTWEFSFSGSDPANDPGAWKGGKGDIDLASMESRTQTDAPFDTGSNGVLGNFLVIRSASLDWTVATPDGVVSPAGSTDATATVRPLRTATTKSIPEYVVFTESTEIDLTLPGVSSAYAVGGGKVVSVVTRGSDEPITIKPARVVFPAAAQLSLADGDLAATVIGGAGYIDVSASSLYLSVSGLTEEVFVNQQKPQVTVTVKNGVAATSAGSAITDLEPVLPKDLVQPDTKPGLPPQDVRTLSSALATTTTVAVSTTTTKSQGATTTTVAANPNSSSTTSVPVTQAPTTTGNPNVVVALAFQGNQPYLMNGSVYSSTNPPMKIWFVNSQGQKVSSATGTCVLSLLPEFDNGSLNGATMTGTLASSAVSGECTFGSFTINGTVGAKYRLRVTVTSSNLNTTIGPHPLN